ncbi:MAG: hypothetical protein ACKOE6_08970 [Flammeovirgaceae bacterium]
MQSKQCSRFIFSVYFLITLGLVALALVVTKGDDVLFINGRHSAFFDVAMVMITQLGAGVVVFSVAACDTIRAI